MVMEELKRITGDRDALKVKLDEAEKQTKALTTKLQEFAKSAIRSETRHLRLARAERGTQTVTSSRTKVSFRDCKMHCKRRHERLESFRRRMKACVKI